MAARKATVKQSKVPRRNVAPEKKKDQIKVTPGTIRADHDWSRWYEAITADRARQGDTDAAREILDDYVGAVQQSSQRHWKTSVGGPNCYVYALYIADAFKAILAGKDAAVALGVKSTRSGRRKGTVTHDPDALAASFHLLVRLGISSKRARSEIHTEFGADPKTIRTALAAFEAYAFPQVIDDETLKVAAKPYRAKIARILARNKIR